MDIIQLWKVLLSDIKLYRVETYYRLITRGHKYQIFIDYEFGIWRKLFNCVRSCNFCHHTFIVISHLLRSIKKKVFEKHLLFISKMCQTLAHNSVTAYGRNIFPYNLHFFTVVRLAHNNAVFTPGSS